MLKQAEKITVFVKNDELLYASDDEQILKDIASEAKRMGFAAMPSASWKILRITEPVNCNECNGSGIKAGWENCDPDDRPFGSDCETCKGTGTTSN